MGTFNTTCAVSKTPITVGQKARVFFLHYFDHSRTKEMYDGLRHYPLQGSDCYPWDHFKIIGFPLLGTYDDYNRYAFNEKEEFCKLTLNQIQSMYTPNRVAENKKLSDYSELHDHMNIDHLSDLRLVQDIEHSGALRTENGFIAKMAIHEEVYQKLILGSEFRHPYGGEVDYQQLLKDIQLIEGQEEDETLKRVRCCMKLDSVLRKDWIAKSISYEDISNTEDKNKLFEGLDKLSKVANFFLGRNLSFSPVTLGGQGYDYEEDAKYLRNLADIIESLHEEDEEELL